ncbi:MAG: MobQ family relaxase [Steroidobacteraceae bacterium]
MAILQLRVQPISRGAGRTATSAAAYRAGERIRNERTGAVYDHSKREDVLHKEIFLPSSLDQAADRMDWARDRSRLWNAAENAEGQRNSRVAREYQVALPAELSAEQRVRLARAFSREIAERYNVAVDLAVHAPRPEGDPRNFHAHLLTTTREVTPDGLGPKTGLDRNGEVRAELGLPKSRQELADLRKRWAELTNDALREANIEARVDHRTLQAQGVDRLPRARLPWGAYKAEKRGERSEIAERVRERHRQRFAALGEKVQRNAYFERAEISAGVPRDADARAETRHEKPEPRPETAGPTDMDARRQQAVRDWLQYRAGLEPKGAGQAHERPPRYSMDEIRQRAVAAWRSLRAREVESQPSAESPREREVAHDRGETEQARDTPGLDGEFSG